MRHPTTGLSEDDLSRLTGSSFSPESCSSNGSSSSSTPSSTPSHTEQQQQQQQQQQHQQHQQTTTNAAHVTLTTSRHKDGSLTPTSLSAATTTAATATSTNYALDAELLKNLKNSSTHTHAHAYSNAIVNGNDNGNGNEHKTKNNNHHSTAGSHFNSSYLPEFIDPLDWQKSRKRKERLDSTSSVTQERKLIRSNSEELLTNENECQQHQQQQQQQQQRKQVHDDSTSTTTAASAVVPLKHKHQVDAIRRVASEDFKKIPHSYDSHIETLADSAVSDLAVKDRSNNSVDVNGGDENDASAANRQQQQQQQQLHEPLPPAYSETFVSGPTKDMTRRSRFETSPARSQRRSPNRTGSAKYHRDSDDSECEHERRRSSERFCKARVPPGRKASGVVKKSGKYLPTKVHGDESTYKYDLSALKYERRGFVSKKLNAAERSNGADYNDNNLIDFHIIRNGSESAAASVLKKLSSSASSPTTAAELSRAASPQRNRKSPTTIDTNSTNNTNSSHNVTSAEALPWDSGIAVDQTEPMLSRRYATARHRPSDCIDTAAKLSKVMPYPQQFHKQTPPQLMDDDFLDPLDTFRAFTSLENLKTREAMQQVIPAMMSFQSPEERLKQLNKRLTALKKKLFQFEEVFVTKMGYRPSQADKLNDKYMKNVLAELSKLRKEKHHLKTDPMGALGLKISGGMDDVKKLEKIKATLSEIEQNLSDKRKEANRTAVLDDLSAEQLLQEKSAVQHGLLYFESLYGRPANKDQRDAARPLYDRYRQLKRMVSRSVALSCCATGGASDLPTILEHEAMVFESVAQQQQQQQYSSNNSTDNSSSSNNNLPASDDGAPNNSNSSNTPNASDDATASTITTTAGDNIETNNINSNTSNTITVPTNKTNETSQPLYGENISALNIDQLWELLDKTREEKKWLKRTIREYETVFEEQNGRKMLKNDRKTIEETYAQYKEKKAKARLLQALIKKHISR